jgi:hypothetical protein
VQTAASKFAGFSIVARGNAPKILDAVEHVLNAMAFLVKEFAEANRILAT